MYEETVTVAQLFEEELEALEEQHEMLIERNTHESRLTAIKIEHVMEYLRARLDSSIEDAYGVTDKKTLH